eukprot:COSAG06_NODE_9_length_37879_cov_13.349735_18_plen_30_part_00
MQVSEVRQAVTDINQLGSEQTQAGPQYNI